MYGEQFTRIDAGDAVVAVYRHIDGEIHARHARDLPDGIVDGVADCNGKACVRMSYHCGVVQAHYGREAGKTGGDHLGSATEAGKEMWLHETRCYANIALHPHPVQADFYP